LEFLSVEFFFGCVVWLSPLLPFVRAGDFHCDCIARFRASVSLVVAVIIIIIVVGIPCIFFYPYL
jgi:hypothetical protein